MISAFILLIYNIIPLILVAFMIGNVAPLYWLSILLYILGEISFALTLILLSWKNGIPDKTKKTATIQASATMSPEKALLRIKSDFEYGLITEEEYQQKRSEIIRNL